MLAGGTRLLGHFLGGLVNPAIQVALLADRSLIPNGYEVGRRLPTSLEWAFLVGATGGTMWWHKATAVGSPGRCQCNEPSQ